MNGDNSRSGTWVAVSLVLGVSMFLSVVVLAITFYRVRVRPDTLSVTGSTKQRITSDVAKWTASFTRQTTGRDLRAATVQMESDLEVVTAYLKGEGVTDEGLTVAPVSVEQQYETVRVGQEWQTRPGEYLLRQRITLETKDVPLATHVAQDITKLMEQGLVIWTEGLEYYYTELPDLRVELLKGAVQDARRRAQTAAENGGSRLGKMKSVSAGVIQVLPPLSTDVSGDGRYDTSTIEKDVMTTVHARFTLR